MVVDIQYSDGLHYLPNTIQYLYIIIINTKYEIVMDLVKLLK